MIPESAVITEKADDRTAQAFCDHLARHGVKISGCNVGGADIRNPRGTRADRAADPVRRAMVRRQGLRFGRRASRQTTGRAARRSLRHLRRLGDTAGELGVTLALETHKGPTQNAAAMLALMSEVDHPHVRLNFDTGNIAYYNDGVDPCDELEQVKHLVRNVHLKDNRGGFEDWYFPALGDGGSVDFTRVRRILDGVGFPGPYTIEIEGIGGEPEPGLDEQAGTDRAKRRVLAIVRLLRLMKASRITESTCWVSGGNAWESNPPRACFQTPHRF